MTNPFFDRPVSAYMTRDVETAEAQTSVEELARTLHGRGISGLPILEGGRIVGVVTRTDLIQLGAMQTGRRWTSPLMALPHRRAVEIMTRDPRVIAPGAPLREAGRIMNEHAVHRLFVVDGDQLVGVISTRELAAAVRDARIEVPLSSVMTALILSVDVHAPLSAAVDLLARVPVSGLIVTDEGLPVGMFTQLDALASRDLPRSTPVEATYDAAVICLPAETKLHRAAAHAAQLDVRRVVVCRAREAVGVISGLDFARVASGQLS
jgi:CBS domain-containing protein